MIRIFCIMGLAALVGACASLSESATMTGSPPSANGSQWSIVGKAKTGTLYDDVTLYVNGTVAATGTLGPNESDHKDVRIAGSYEHHIVLGICSRSDGDPLTYTCDVLVDGTAVDTLHW